MHILVTGGAGYIGSTTVRMLIEGGAEVTVLDTMERGHERAVVPDARIVTGDVGDRSSVRNALSGVDAVLHCAGYIEVAESQSNPSKYFDNNLARPLVLLEEMDECGVDAIVFSSTAAVYGEPRSIPILEDALTDPINAYGASKLCFENVLEGMVAAERLRAVRFRYFNVAGAWPDGSLGEAHDPETHIIPRILNSVYEGQTRFEVFGNDYPTEDGTCVRDYLHVCDLADAHVKALDSLVGGGASGVYNLGNGDGYSNLEVVRSCAKAVGAEVEVTFGPRRPGDPAVLVASSDAAQKRFGWSAQRPGIDTMTADAWRWHKDNPQGFNS